MGLNIIYDFYIWQARVLTGSECVKMIEEKALKKKEAAELKLQRQQDRERKKQEREQRAKEVAERKLQRQLEQERKREEKQKAAELKKQRKEEKQKETGL